MASIDVALLAVDDNQLIGALPELVCSMSALEKLAAQENRLSGTFPSAMASMSDLNDLSVESNQLKGCIPDALRVMTGIVKLSLSSNELCGELPGALGFMARMFIFNINHNCLSGSLPDAMGSIAGIMYLKMQDNKLSGHISDSWVSTLKTTFNFMINHNRLSGPIPVAIREMLRVRFFYLHDNQFSGPIPNATGSMFPHLVLLFKNKLSGTIPDGMSSMTSVSRLDISYNKVSGPIPDAIGFLWRVRAIQMAHNSMSGSIPDALSSLGSCEFLQADHNKLAGAIRATTLLPIKVFINSNQLTGAFPPLKSGVEGLIISDNRLEGTVPETMSSRLSILGMSGQIGRRGVLRGALPPSLSRASKLYVLVSSHHALAGVIPQLSGTLKMLALHDNEFAILSNVPIMEDGSSVVLVCNNHLSCHVPQGIASARMSLVALGNHLQHRRRYPDWIMPFEKDDLFWISRHEGRSLLVKLIGSSIIFTIAAGRKREYFRLLRNYTGPASRLQHACSVLLSSISRGALMRVLFLMLLLSPSHLYHCPRTLALASACFRGSNATNVLVVWLWASFSFHAPAIEGLRALGRSGSKAAGRTSWRKSVLVWLLWILLTLLLSLLAIVCQVGKSVPGVLGSGTSGMNLLYIFSACVGTVHGLIGSFATPFLAGKLTWNRHLFALVANLLMSCVFPALVIIYFDTKCFGNWVTLWAPCRRHAAHQFKQVLGCTGAGRGCSLTTDPAGFADDDDASSIEVLRQDEICNPRRAGGTTSVSNCMQLTLLRLQDMWLGKFMTLGLLTPAFQISGDVGFADSTAVVGKLALLLVYAMITSGHLPLMMPMLCLTMFTEAVVIAVGRSQQSLKYTQQHDVATPSVIVARVASSIVHAMSFSGDLLATAMVSIMILSHMLHQWSQLAMKKDRNVAPSEQPSLPSLPLFLTQPPARGKSMRRASADF